MAYKGELEGGAAFISFKGCHVKRKTYSPPLLLQERQKQEVTGMHSLTNNLIIIQTEFLDVFTL